jgi:hypothetical protein
MSNALGEFAGAQHDGVGVGDLRGVEAGGGAGAAGAAVAHEAARSRKPGIERSSAGAGGASLAPRQG